MKNEKEDKIIDAFTKSWLNLYAIAEQYYWLIFSEEALDSNKDLVEDEFCSFIGHDKNDELVITPNLLFSWLIFLESKIESFCFSTMCFDKDLFECKIKIEDLSAGICDRILADTRNDE